MKCKSPKYASIGWSCALHTAICVTISVSLTFRVMAEKEAKSECIYCRQLHHDETVEHIVPRALGNLHYILRKGLVCSKCNNRFARFENEVVSSDLFLEERKARGLLRQGYDVQSGSISTMAMTRFLSKMAFESLYHSKRKIWTDYDMEPVRHLLVDGIPDKVIAPVDESQLRYRDIPGWIERFRLRNNGLRLEYASHTSKLYFRFTFGRIVASIRIT